MKIVNLEEVKTRINTRFPEQPYEVIEYTKVTAPFTIKCLACGEITKYSNLHNFLTVSSKNKKYLCQCYNQNSNYNKHKRLQQQVLEVIKLNKDIEFVGFDYRENTKKYSVNCRCKKCSQIFNKDLSSFIKNSNCLYCSISNNLNTLGFQARLPKEYELIGEYKNNETKVLIRHECGFIWNIKPHYLMEKISHGYCGCPKCNHKKSLGEKKIANFLQINNIYFIVEHSFDWQSNSKFRYDFYVPGYNLVIEYMGQQHFYENNFFHDTLAERQEHDKIKYQEAINNNLNYLRIDYFNFSKIEEILTHWFNDYSEKK